MSGPSTISGTSFQAEVGACLAGLLLTERPLARLDVQLPGTPQKLYVEAGNEWVDDLVVITQQGRLYVQAKSSISFSPHPDGKLAAVAAQFVGQYRAGVEEAGSRRNLTPAHDRLVLAVGPRTAKAIRQELREALDRNRTGAATGLPSALQSALTKFTRLLDQAWQQAAGAAITPAERQALLAVCAVVCVEEIHYEFVVELLRDIVAPPLERALFTVLAKWADKAGTRRTGGDAAAIRCEIAKQMPLREPPSFRQDVAHLTAYSADTLAGLARFTTLEAPEGPLQLRRPVVRQVLAAARVGSLAITGEPGAGKSGVLYAVARHLSQQHPVYCFKIEDRFDTLEALAQRIGLTHSLPAVLAQVSGPQPAYLLLDALDASRGNRAEAAYQSLLRQVAALPGWHIVASVRTFDLRQGREWQRLFSSHYPLASSADPSLRQVRHLPVEQLTADERAELACQSPSLQAALEAGGPQLEDLALNLFNLSLLADLLRRGTRPEALAGVATRSQLLAYYWRERIGEDTSRLAGLTRLVAQLLQARTLTVAQGTVEPATAPALDQLIAEGVLLLDQPRQAPGYATLGFRHHILFDYAVASLALLPSRAEARRHLARSRGAGLLVAPSLAYWVGGLRHSGELTADAFWEFIANLVADEEVDFLVRVEVARVAVDEIGAEENLRGLSRVISRPDGAAGRSLQQLVMALRLKADHQQAFAPGPWVHLVAGLEVADAQLGLLQVLLELVLPRTADPALRQLLGRAARRLLTRVLESGQLTYLLVKSTLPLVVQTYDTDPAASHRLLARPLEISRFQQFGYLEVPVLARNLLPLAACDELLAVELVHRAFGRHEFSYHEFVPLAPSAILRLSLTPAQAFELAANDVERHFAQLLADYPRTGLRLLAAALRGARERRNSWPAASASIPLLVDGTLYGFEEDDSAEWAPDPAGSTDDYAGLYRRFQQWLADEPEDSLLAELPALLLAATGGALIWRALFEAGIRHPQRLGYRLRRAAASRAALESASTRQAALDLLRCLYPHLPLAERQQIEQDWLSWEFTGSAEPRLERARVPEPLLRALGAGQLATEEARAFLRAAAAAPLLPEEEERLAEGAGEGETEAASPTELPAADASLASLGQEVWYAVASVQTIATEQALIRLHAALRALEAAVGPEPGGAGSLPEAGVASVLAQGLGELLPYRLPPGVNQPLALARLLELTHHASPPGGAPAEEKFAGSPIRYYQGPRVEAARALAKLAAVPGQWPLVSTRFAELLLRDSHPAVRTVLAEALYALSLPEPVSAWQLATRFAETERNPRVIQYAASTLQIFAHEDPLRLEPIWLQLLARVEEAALDLQLLVKWLLVFALEQQLPASQARLRNWLTYFARYSRELKQVVYQLRSYLIRGYGASDPAEHAVRQRARQLLEHIVIAVEPTLHARESSKPPTPTEVTAYVLFAELAGQLYFAVGRQVPVELQPIEAKHQFLTEYATAISRFTLSGIPGVVHQMLGLLSKFAVADPPLCFDLFTAALLTPGKDAQYEQEPQGAKRFVQLVGEFLADYQELFADEVRRTRLLDCLAVFSAAGWPEARQLLYQLPTLFR